MFDHHVTDCCRGLIKCQISWHRCSVCRGSFRKFKAENALINYNAAVPETFRIYLNVPFGPQKDEAKKLGARWNPDRKLWYCDARRDHDHIALFSKWMKKATPAPTFAAVPQPSSMTVAPKTEAPVISFDELEAALRFADTQSGAVASPAPAPEAEKVYVSRSIARAASQRQ